MIESELIALLKADAAVSDLVGEMVALNRMEEGDESPYIVCQLIYGTRTGSMSSTGCSPRKRMQVSCYAANIKLAKEIAEVAVNAIENYEGFKVVFLGEQDLFDAVAKLDYTVLDYSITQHID
ncbi:MAG TPA: DUF3168 domain-containing protein [Cellvibrio sp.]|nr:DUF3168 domain-containing protein [Cellvibrio sp.]